MPDLNPGAGAPVLRRPCAMVKLGGQVVTGWKSIEVNNNAYRSADEFRVDFSIKELQKTHNEKWFSEQKSIDVEIFVGFPKDALNPQPGELESLIYGQTDNVVFNPVTGTIELSGRDLTARLIDTKTSAHYVDKTSSMIAELLAKTHGLTPIVTKTTGKVGTYYGQDHIQITHMQSEWDLLAYLANIEDFDVFVRGRELHFEERKNGQKDQYRIFWEQPKDGIGWNRSNVSELHFTRALTISKGVAVAVHSWNTKQKKGFTAYWPREAKNVRPGQAKAQTQIYPFTIPGQTHEKAQQRAKAIYESLVKHEKKMTCTLPGDNILQCDRIIRLEGTGTDFDQLYYPESITRTIDIDQGYKMTVQAKNQDDSFFGNLSATPS